MTRFARARGSKASNERVPEEATSWSVMRQEVDRWKLNNTDEQDLSNDTLASNFNQSNKHNTVDGNSVNEKIWEEFDNKNLYKLSKKHHNNKSADDKSKSIPVLYEKITPITNCKTTKSNKRKSNISDDNFDEEIKQREETSEIDRNETFIKKKRIAKKEDHKNTTNLSFSINDADQQDITVESKNNKMNCKRKNNITCSDIDSDSDHATEITQLKNKPTNNIGKIKAGITKKMKHNNGGNQSYKSNGFVKEKSFAMNRMSNLSYFQGYLVKLEDADRLYKLRKDMRANGIPRKVVLATLDAERRKAEKALARDKKIICYKCRKSGHNMTDCPELEDPRGICYKCGSTEHSAKSCRVVQGDSYKFTRCFICQEQGHLAKQCPDNPRGLYPKGGACKICGDVTHLRNDCPQLIKEKEKYRITVDTVHNNSVEDLDDEPVKIKKNDNFKKNSVITF